MSKICMGCGIALQDSDEQALGYTPNLENNYCKRCFRLKNYGEKRIEERILDEDILKKVNSNTGMAFFFVDFLNINRYSLALYQKINIPKVLVISKSDILRKEMKYEKIKLWLKKVYHINDPILFISNKKKSYSENIFKVLDNYGYHKAYIMGITNAGKSTFLNSILAKHGIKKEILASNKPNTTLDFIKLKIDSYTLYDTPGFSYLNDQNIINKELKMTSFIVKPKTTFVIQDYKFYFPKENKVTFYGNLSVSRLYKEDKQDHLLNIPANYDIVLPGIGFINIKMSTEVYVSASNLEVRCDISEVEYE